MNTQTENILHFGILGEKLGHTLSPEIHADLLKQQNLTGIYEVYEMSRDEVSQVLDMMKEKHITGMNVTIPYKTTLCQMVDVLDDRAKEIGAVNTILMKDNISYGYNTDYIGVISMFQKAGVELTGKQIVILGSGGASKALIYGFHLEGASVITIAARNKEARDELKKQFPYIRVCDLEDIPSGDIIINTTPVGMFPHAGVSPVGASVIRRFKIASDIVYNPLITEFLHIAREEGLQIVTGLMMLVDQAIGSEEIWLGKKLDYNMGNRIHEELTKLF